jgi:hypothetical protein
VSRTSEVSSKKRNGWKAKKPSVSRKENMTAGKPSEGPPELVRRIAKELRATGAKPGAKSGIILFGPDVMPYGKPGASLYAERSWEIAIYFPDEEQGTAWKVRNEIHELMRRKFRDVHQRLEDSQASFHNSHTTAQTFRSALHVPNY